MTMFSMNRKIIVLIVVFTIAGIGIGFIISFVFSSITYLSQILKFQSEIRTLSTDYDSLKEDYNELSSKHDELLSIIERGEAIAKSVTWLT